MTLKQVIKQLRTIVLSHRLVKSYYFGNITEWDEFTGLVYPSVVITMDRPTIEKNLTRVGFTIWIADRLKEDSSNRNDVLSDTLQMLNDFVSDVDDIEIDWLPGVEGDGDFFEDQRGNDNGDLVGGVKFDFSISIKTPKDTCQVPRNTEEVASSAILTEQGFEIITENSETIITE